MSPGITREDWLLALEDAQCPHVNDEDAVTANELAKLLNITQHAAAYRLRALYQQGKVTRTWKQGYADNGHRRHYLAYKLKPELIKKLRAKR